MYCSATKSLVSFHAYKTPASSLFLFVIHPSLIRMCFFALFIRSKALALVIVLFLSFLYTSFLTVIIEGFSFIVKQ